MGLSLPHILAVAVVVLLLFGRGKVSELMGDFAKGIKAFKKGLADDETAGAKPAEPVQSIAHGGETAPGTAIPASHISGSHVRPADKV